jgi:signal transduction histidine kinase/GAF domain-containing protein
VERATRSEQLPTIGPHWVGFGFGVLTLVLIVYAAALGLPTPALLALAGLALVAPALGLLIAPPMRGERLAAIGLLIGCVSLAFGAIAASGGAASPLWPALVVPLVGALLLLPERAGAGIAAGLWLAYGAFVPLAPPVVRLEVAADWLLHGALVGLLLLLLERTVVAQAHFNARSAAREAALRRFLAASNRLRLSSSVQGVLEEVAGAVQAAGDFDCVSLSLLETGGDKARVVAAIGASGRRLNALEGLAFPYAVVAERMQAGSPAGAFAVSVTTLPFRNLPDERHLVLPLQSQTDELRGLLTVSVASRQAALLDTSLPLLELLANQAAVAIDNADLYATMEQRVRHATSDLARGAEELRRARDRAEVLYQLARALSLTLDERQVLEWTLRLVAGSIGADRGGIMLVEPVGGRLLYRTTLERHSFDRQGVLERGQGLAGWVLANREPAIVADTTRDPRWQVRSRFDAEPRSVLAVPLMQEREAMGVLLLIHSDVGHFSAEHAQIATAAAAQAAAALIKAQLHRYVSEQSERLAVVARQREEEASKLMAVLRSIGDGVVVSDRHGLVRIINPATEAILGIRAEAFLGRPLATLPGVPADIEAAAAEERMRKFIAGERTLRAHCAAVHASHGEPLGSVVVYHDLTREQTADRLKSELVATVSHELRTPMTSIRGYVDMLLLGTFGELPEHQREPLQVIKGNVVRLVLLIEELLDLSRAEAGEVKLRTEGVDVGGLLQEIGAGLAGQFGERRVDLTLDLPAGLPPARADRQRLEQIAVNLIGNACKYTPRGGKVRVALRNGGDELRVDVQDTGVGIPDEAKPHIFTPFYRADNPLRDEVGGTGLGLSITRKLVELHGGRIWFESQVNQGSTFSFTLPVQRG